VLRHICNKLGIHFCPTALIEEENGARTTFWMPCLRLGYNFVCNIQQAFFEVRILICSQNPPISKPCRDFSRNFNSSANPSNGRMFLTTKAPS